jgi:hypothetical protein
MPTTYEPIATTTLPSATSSYTFTGVSSAYTDLILVARGSTDSSTNNMGVRFNGDTGSNYSHVRLLTDGSTPSGETYATRTFAAVGDWGNDNCMVIIHINNYSNSSKNKTTLSRSVSTSEGYTSIYAGNWRNTSVIDSITFFRGPGGNLQTGTVLTLYGIKAA